MSKRVWLVLGCLLFIVALLTPFGVSCSQPKQTPTPAPAPTPAPTPAPAKEIELTSITPIPTATRQMQGFMMWIDYVNEIGKGKIHINNVGGPEVIAGVDQFEALRTGRVDIANSVGGYHLGTVPESQFFSLTPWPTPQFDDTIEREKESGLYDLVTDVYHDHGVHFLGRLLLYAPMHMFIVEPAYKLSDLKGRKLRSIERYNSIVEAVEAVPVSIAGPETYTALERGTVEGVIYSLYDVMDYGCNDFVKYAISEPFYETDCVAQINLETWNSLPEDVKDLLNESMQYAEKEFTVKFYKDLWDKLVQEATDEGFQGFIDLPSDEAKFWRETLDKGTLAMLEEKGKPEYVARFMEIRKKAGL